MDVFEKNDESFHYQGFLPHWTKTILQQMKRKFWKVPDALFSSLRGYNNLGCYPFIHRIRHYTHFDTTPPGVFGRNGFHGESA
jgi:hypothetical protein